jgi:flavin reductase (DIM6/NTAB) family NADH-FMN oxidoreductase RutF
LPVHFDCEVVGEVRLGTHVMFLGEVRRVLVRSDVTVANPLEWLPWANIRSTG